MTAEKNLSDQENEAIEELRKRMKSDMKPEMYNDISMFYRFLKARDFNVNNSEKMLRKHLQWRKEKQMENILTEYEKPEVLEKYFPNTRIGFDRDGSTCRYVPIGNIDAKGLSKCGKFEDLDRAIIYANESDVAVMKENIERLGKKEDRCTYIFDFESMNIAKATDKLSINVFIRVATSYQDNYPERLKAAYVINASVYFAFVFSIVKKFLANTVISKVHIYSKDGWKEELRKVFEPDDLPAFLGGNKTDPDGNPLCKTFICHGGPVPNCYFAQKGKKSLANSPGSQKLNLGRSSFYEKILQVEEPNSLLEWEFETKSRDIGFGLFYEEKVDNETLLTELIPAHRIDTESYPETGMYKCEKAGTYILLFDNTYSWIRSKEIYYRIIVVSPKEHEAELEV